jgi:hypothetical protein
MKYFFALCLLFSISGTCQYKSFGFTSNGDTINIIDKNDLKQGRWRIDIAALREEPAYVEEGVFKDNKREGIWYKYDLYGVIVAKENYKWGNKHGKQVYAIDGSVEREESWLSMDPSKKFDTIDVPDVYNSFVVTRKIIKVEPYALRHGTFTYFNAANGRVEKKEEYLFGKLVDKNEMLSNNFQTSDSIATPKKVAKPQAVLDFDKKNKGKKSYKYKDGS